MSSTPSTDTGKTGSNKDHQSDDLTLSSEDVERLLNQDSPDTRETIARKIGGRYSLTKFKERESWIAEQIFRVLMKDTEIKVREALADELKNAENAPRDVIIHMAQDELTVATPVLEVSKVLSDADLIKITQSYEEEARLQAMAKREKLNGRVSDELLKKGKGEVTKTLLDNKGAMITDKGFEQIMQEHAGNNDIVYAMVDRGNLPLEIVEKLVHFVSHEIAYELQHQYSLSEAQIKKYSQDSRERVTLGILDRDMDDDMVQRVIDQMYANQRLSPSIIIASLCKGNLNFFERAMAKLAKVPTPNARKLIHDAKGKGFEGIYKKTELPGSMFQSISALLQVILNLTEEDKDIADKKEFSNRVVEGLLAHSEEEPMENMSYLIALVRQHTRTI